MNPRSNFASHILAATLAFALLWIPRAALPRASAGETLSNGIELPDQWPPPPRPAEALKAREPQPVPYLKNPPAIIPIDAGRQLFVDDFLIEHTTLQREFHQPRMHPGNPVLKPEKITETEGKLPMAMPFSDGVWFDPQDQLFKMWYMAGLCKHTALATSRDGLAWERPEQHVRRGTNLVQPDPRDSSTVWMDLEDRDPQRRFKMWRAHSEDKRFGLSLHFSPDGIHWGPRVLRTGSIGDRSTVFWNPFRKVWVYSLRHGWGQPRARRYWEVKDLLAGPHWDAIGEPPMWLASDKLDPEREDLKITPQLYNFDAVAYESLMVGLFTIWRGDENIPPGRPKPNSLFVGFSRDGYHWDRPDRRPFIAVSENRGDWNWGNLQSAGGCFLVVKDELWFYVSGRAGGVNEKVRDGNASAGLAMLRRDGFASMVAGPSGGQLTTRPLRLTGKRLFVNVNAQRGALRAEILDQAGKVIAPFSRENCQPVTADTTGTELRWKGAADLPAPESQPIRIRFHLENAGLYSFWASPDSKGASHGYVAAGGPGFTGPVDTVGLMSAR